MKEKSLAIMHISSSQCKAFTIIFYKVLKREKIGIICCLSKAKKQKEVLIRKKKLNREWASGELVFRSFHAS